MKKLDLTNNIGIIQGFCPIENPDEINLSDEILTYSTAVKEKRNIVNQPTNSFSLKVGGTYFDVSRLLMNAILNLYPDMKRNRQSLFKKLSFPKSDFQKTSKTK